MKDSHDYAFLLGFLYGAECMQKQMQHEIEEEIRRETETFDRFVQLKNRAHELATMLWAAIKTVHDRDARIAVMNEVRAGFDRLETSDQQRQGQARS